MIKHVAARIRQVGARANSSTAAAARRAARPTAIRSPVTGVPRSPPSPTSTTTSESLLQDVAPALSYGAWTHANPHLTRQERIEGLRKFMQARNDTGQGRPPTAQESKTGQVGNRQPVAHPESGGISCAKQPRTRAERIAQIQRFADATRAVGNIEYSQGEHNESKFRDLDPIIVSPLPAGWRLSGATGIPVFSYGEWLRSHDDSEMNRVTAARQFVRYVRQ